MGFLFLAPPLACAAGYISLWLMGELRHPLLLGALCATGLVLQWTGATYSVPWVVGLVTNSVMGIFMVIRLKMP